MAHNLTQQEIDSLWDQGFRPYEIYTYNKESAYYFGDLFEAGKIAGWNIEFVFSTRELLKSYPYFDAVIGIDSMASVETVWKG
jgi:hypothetical protein